MSSSTDVPGRASRQTENKKFAPVDGKVNTLVFCCTRFERQKCSGTPCGCQASLNRNRALHKYPLQGCPERKMTMIPGYYDHEKFVQTHRQKLLREAGHERLLAQLPQPAHSALRRFLATPALFLRSLRARLQERAKRRKQINGVSPPLRRPHCERGSNQR